MRLLIRRRGGRADLYVRGGKRGLDLLVVISSLPVTVPLTAIGWMAARLSTGDNGFFGQVRVGRHRQPFVIWKLRTMRPAGRDDEAAHLAGVTVRTNTRITRTGALLRRTRLDELPQLWNVLRGDMSLVGPRPDVPPWLDWMGIAKLAPELRPGLISFGSLAYLDEEDLLAGEEDPVAAYADRVLPHKLWLNELYATHISLRLDMRLIAVSPLALLSHARAVSVVTRLVDDLNQSPRASSPTG